MSFASAVRSTVIVELLVAAITSRSASDTCQMAEDEWGIGEWVGSGREFDGEWMGFI